MRRDLRDPRELGRLLITKCVRRRGPDNIGTGFRRKPVAAGLYDAHRVEMERVPDYVDGAASATRDRTRGKPEAR